METVIAEVFRRILTRRAEKVEIQKLVALYQETLSRYRQMPEQAKKLLQVGRYPQNTAFDPAEQAALMLVVSAIFNLDEAMSKT